MGSTAHWTRVHLLRHGSVEAHWRGRVYGDLDVPLSAHGQAEAREAARRLAGLELAAIWTSDLERARFGAECLAKGRGLVVRVDPALREIRRGAWAGLSFEELEARDPGAFADWSRDPENRRPVGGESLGDLRARVLPAVRRIAESAAGGEVAVVSHAWVLRVVLTVCPGMDPLRAADLAVPPACWNAVDWPVRDGGSEAGTGPDVGPHDTRRPQLVGLGLDRAPPRRRA